jgi:hypothetical protein
VNAEDLDARHLQLVATEHSIETSDTIDGIADQDIQEADDETDLVG